MGPAPQGPGGFGGGYGLPGGPGGPPGDPPSQGGLPPQPFQKFDDTSGIISTYEDMSKDDSFKTRKLPNPKEKKGFFDGLFKKEK